jgi:hypothetical protein
MQILAQDGGEILLDGSSCRIAPPVNQGERNAYREAVIFAAGAGAANLPQDRTPLLLFDRFDRLLAVGERLRGATHLYWADNSLRFKTASLFAKASRWILLSPSDETPRGWIGRRSKSDELIELETEWEMSEPVQAFAVWLAARLLREQRM